MDDIEPRYEFRAWARKLGMVEAQIPYCHPRNSVRESDEVYIISSGSKETNVKIREGRIDIKVLVQKRNGLEQWRPSMKYVFPISARVLVTKVFSALGVTAPTLGREEYSLNQFLDDIVRPHCDLVSVSVFKRRLVFAFNDCTSDLAKTWINGVALQTVAVESINPSAILETKRLLRLDNYENVSYPQAIKGIVGLEPLPRSFLEQKRHGQGN